MKRIIKGTEPSDLLNYRLSDDLNKSYKNYHPKDSLKKSLLKEQGYICAFCMRRISESNMEIAHWEPIKGNFGKPERQLDYKNLLASCAGNRGNPDKLQHCNAKQADTPLKVNPTDLDRNCENLIRYSNSGRIFSDDEGVNNDLQIILNLNVETLVKNRKMALDTVIQKLIKLFPNKDFSKIELTKRVNEWKSKDSRGYYNEYCQFIIYTFEKRL
jgi:uncharacterized protein (TIGR02646 family)